MNFPPILRVRDLVVEYRSGGIWSRNVEAKRAVDGVGFELGRGETLGLVGESGCGKSTTARAIIRLVDAAAGTVHLNVGADGMPEQWRELTTLSTGQMRPLRQKIQMIFQDPYASLNPRMTAAAIIAEPMHIHRKHPRREIPKRVDALLVEVGLESRMGRRYPHEFSGGQRQRIGIARALALNPQIVICDEPVSALDVSIRAQVLNLLLDLQERRGLSYLFIAHDLSVVKRISHRVAVMNRGKIVELASADDIYRNPKHDYTKSLLAAIPTLEGNSRVGDFAVNLKY